MWTAHTRDQTTQKLKFDLDLHCPRKLLVSSSGRKLETIEMHKNPFGQRDKINVT